MTTALGLIWDALQCSDRIIDLLSTSEYVTIPFLKAAYPIVLKALEYNWFRKYEETFRQSEQSQKRPKFELLMSFKRAMRKISGSNILRKMGYLLTEIRKHGLSSTLSDYIECLYQEQLRDIQEITEGRPGNYGNEDHFEFRITFEGLSYNLEVDNLRLIFEGFPILEPLHDSVDSQLADVELLGDIGLVVACVQESRDLDSLCFHLNTPVHNGKDILMTCAGKAELQLNVSPTLLSEAIMKFKREGISHGLFHNLALDVLPSIYKAWDIMHLEQNACGGREKFKAKVKLRLKVIQSDITRHNILGKNDLSSFMEGTGRNAWSVCLGVPKTWSSHACEVEHDKSTRKQHGSSPSYIL
ncbi:Hypothetical predicted protein [Octopus vulgaris]|uniref:Uncharacterized protein n=1 Tax=Octopus vulgaris TaxID=6645 RepID=A0AA36EXT4_OCTVU|nr:Hypothetical predicted protein [Octopus vulgaris]